MPICPIIKEAGEYVVPPFQEGVPLKVQEAPKTKFGCKAIETPTANGEDAKETAAGAMLAMALGQEPRGFARPGTAEIPVGIAEKVATWEVTRTWEMYRMDLKMVDKILQKLRKVKAQLPQS